MIISNIISSIISAILITFIFAVWSDSEINEYDLTGNWELKTVVSDAELDRYVNMELFYYTQIVQFKENILLNGEKNKEIIKKKIREYNGKNKYPIKCAGEKKLKFFTKNKLLLNCKENGSRRESITIFNLKIKSNNKIIGTYSSSISKSQGTVQLTRIQ